MPSCRTPSLRRRAGTALLAAATLPLTLPATALAGGFSRDRTPLPKDVTGGGSGGTQIASGGSTSGALVRTVIGLLVVLAVIYGVYWLLRAYGRSRSGSSSDQMQVIATTTLGANRSLQLVRSGDEVILVGVAEQSVTPIRIYSAEEARRFGVGVEPGPFAQPGPIRPDRPSGPFLSRFLEALRQRTVRQ